MLSTSIAKTLDLFHLFFDGWKKKFSAIVSFFYKLLPYLRKERHRFRGSLIAGDVELSLSSR